MRTIIILCAMLLVGAMAWLAVTLRTPSHFGGKFTGAPKAQVASILEHPSDFLGKLVTIEGTVQGQCPATGCFFYFNVGEKSLKIELGELGEKLPQRPGGSVTVEGQLVQYGDSYEFVGTAVEFH